MVVVLSMMLTPVTIILFEKYIQPRLSGTCDQREDDEIDQADNPVIIAGYGRFGQIVSRLLKARAFDRTHVYELIDAGADFIARETFGSAMAMGEEALRLLGHSDERAKRLAATFDKHDTEGMHRLHEVWGDDHEYGLRIHQNLENLEQVLQADSEGSET